MTLRDANAHNMLDLLDLRYNVSGPGTIPPPGSVTTPLPGGD